MTHFHDESQSGAPSDRIGWLAGWLTLAALLAILFATLFPFDFSSGQTALRRAGFFLFWFAPAAKHWKGWIANVLLFAPFGFGLAWWARTKGWRRLSQWIVIGLAGCLLSYAVEFLQLYLPRRDASWDDVVMNTLGALFGWLVFEWLGAWLLRLLGEALGELTTIFER